MPSKSQESCHVWEHSKAKAWLRKLWLSSGRQVGKHEEAREERGREEKEHTNPNSSLKSNLQWLFFSCSNCHKRGEMAIKFSLALVLLKKLIRGWESAIISTGSLPSIARDWTRPEMGIQCTTPKWVAGTKLPEWPLLPLRVYVGRKLESRAGAG